MTSALVTYTGPLAPVAEAVATEADGAAAVRLVLSSSLVLTYADLREIDRVIKAHLAARDLLAELLSERAVNGATVAAVRDRIAERVTAAELLGRPR